MYIDGAEIRRRRRTAGITQAALARMVGASHSLISRIERGCLQADTKLTDALAEALHADSADFRAETPQQTTPLIGKVIRDARRAAGLRQQDLAELIGCKSITISHIERGYRRPNRKLLGAVTKALELDDGYFDDVMFQATGPDLSKPPDHIGQAIQRARWAAGMRQVDLAKAAGCGVNIISYIERGDRRPSRKLANAIAEALNVDLSGWPTAEDMKSQTPVVPPPAYIGEAIQRARRSAGLSQRELAGMVGCRKTDVYCVEVGHRRQPPRELITAVAKVLKVDPADWPVQAFS